MRTVPWTKAELKWAKDKIDKRIHPVDFYQELNDKFGNERTPDSIRKRVGSIAHCIPNASKKKFASPLVVNAPIDKQVAFDVQLSRISAEKKIIEQKYAHARKMASLTEVIAETFREHIRALPPVKEPEKIKLSPGKDISKEELVLLLSDIHAGEVIKKEEVQGLNEYNFDIVAKRLKYLSDSIRSIAKNKLAAGYRFDTLHVLALGDWVSGMIHEELLEGAEGNIIEWTVNLAYIVAQMMRELLTDFEHIEFTGVVGNHGRLHKKPRYKGRYVNWDYVCYQLLSLFLANEPRIKFDIPKSFWTLRTINGHTFLLLHGDNIHSYLSIPWYGIQKVTSSLKALLASKNQTFDYIVLGHFHNHGMLDQVKGQIIINGSLIGGNEYSIGRLFTSSEACQHLCGVHPKFGTTFTFRLQVSNGDHKSSCPYQYVKEPLAWGDLVANLHNEL